MTVKRTKLLGLILMADAVFGQQGTRDVLDGPLAPAGAAGATVGSFPLSGFESVNPYSGGLNFSLPLITAGGRGEAAYTLRQNVETRWTLSRSETFNSFVSYAKPNGTAFARMGFGPGVLETRVQEEFLLCPATAPPPGQGEQQSYRSRTLMILHWSGSDGSESDLVDTLTNGEPRPTQKVCNFNQVQGGDGTFNRGNQFVAQDGSGLTYVADAPGA